MRLDQELVNRGLFSSREKARRAVMAGAVQVGGRRVDKPGSSVNESAKISVAKKAEPFVSRAGRKLAAALEHFELVPENMVCMDVGASTGGFSDCLLQQGARRVYAIDVGYGQLDFRLRQDPRIVVMERVNARYLAPDALPETCDLITVDVSFISLLKIVPALLHHLRPRGALLTLIKPQFEAPRGSVGKGGILRDRGLRAAVVEKRVEQISALGLESVGTIESPVRGAGGNVESLALFLKNPPKHPRSGPPSGPRFPRRPS